MRFRSKKQLYWYAGGALFIALLHALGVLGSVERGIRQLSDRPIHWMYTEFQFVRERFAGWNAEMSARDRIPEIERERDVLKTRIALVEAENASLRRELGFSDRKKWETVGAEVIAKTTDIAQQALIITKGTAAGVRPGQAVFTEQGILVGEVIAAEQERAIVRLLNDRQSRVGAVHAVSARPVGIVEGGYGLGVRLTLIPPEEVVQVGDLIVTGNVSEHIPRGLLIGRVASVGRETYEPFQHALLEPVLPYEQISFVSVILKAQ